MDKTDTRVGGGGIDSNSLSIPFLFVGNSSDINLI